MYCKCVLWQVHSNISFSSFDPNRQPNTKVSNFLHINIIHILQEQDFQSKGVYSFSKSHFQRKISCLSVHLFNPPFLQSSTFGSFSGAHHWQHWSSISPPNYSSGEMKWHKPAISCVPRSCSQVLNLISI